METTLKQYVDALFGMMQVVLAMRMHPLSGETEMPPARIREVTLETFRMVRAAYEVAVKAANEEKPADKVVRETLNKKSKASFTAALESALAQAKPPVWAIAYRDMMATNSPAGGDKEMLSEVKAFHDKMRSALEAFAFQHPILSDWDKAIPRIETKGRPAGSTNKPKEAAPVAQTTPPTENVGAQN